MAKTTSVMTENQEGIMEDVATPITDVPEQDCTDCEDRFCEPAADGEPSSIRIAKDERKWKKKDMVLLFPMF